MQRWAHNENLALLPFGEALDDGGVALAASVGATPAELQAEPLDPLALDVVFDEELSPAQGRNIQSGLGGLRVIDRTTLILQIFAQRARTREAKLQVAAARMRYMLPRLQTMSGFLTTGAGMEARGGSGGGGGQFLKGAGESPAPIKKGPSKISGLLRKKSDGVAAAPSEDTTATRLAA